MGLTSRTKWTALAGALLAQHVAGLFYLYGLFSEPIKDEFNLSQGIIDGLGSTANLGGNLGVEIGFLMDKMGPQFVLLVSGVLACGSWYSLWASVHFSWPFGTTTWPLYLIMFIQGHAQMGIDCAVVPTISRHFPMHRGSAIGLAKSFVGLSGALASSMYQAFFKDHQFQFVLFLSVYLLVVIWSSALWVAMPNTEMANRLREAADDQVTSHRFRVAYRFMYTILGLLFVNALIVRFLGPGLVIRIVQCVAVFSCFGALLYYLFTCTDGRPGAADLSETPALNSLSEPLLPGGVLVDDATVVHNNEVDSVVHNEVDSVVHNNEVDSVVHNEVDSVVHNEVDSVVHNEVDSVVHNNEVRSAVHTNEADPAMHNNSEIEPAEEDEGFTFLGALQSQVFWLHFGMLLTTCGSGLVLINNLGQLTEVAGIGERDKTLLVSLQSLCNCLGRLLAGTLSDAFVRRRHPRPAVFLVAQGAMAAAMLLLSAATEPALYAGTALVGLAYGASFSLSPIIATEVYGKRALGAVYASLAPGVSMGSFFFATYWFSSVYDAHADRDSGKCTQPSCVRSTFLGCFGVCLFSMALCAQLVRRTRAQYAVLYGQ